ncbi:MAG: hypothetical protein E7812_02200 [Phenylobacterium sp.]|nr:MAG: hypothetical protein E7812_02200 [Phenylobacterium sp.]
MSAADARAAIRALRVGAAPVNHAALLSVGQEAVQGVFDRTLARLAAAEPTNPILVEGPWGSGKSQTLALARALARERAIAAATVTFNARTVPLSHPNRLYPVLAQTIEVGGATGLRSVVRNCLNDPILNGRLASFANERADAFGAALRDLHGANSRGDKLLLGRSGAWSILLGVDLTIRDDQGRKLAAVGRLGALAALMRACGHGGLVVLGDELESLGQLWSSASRASAYNAMGSLLGVPSILWVFGAAGNFERMVAYDLDQGMRSSWRVKDAGRSFFGQWCAGDFRRLSPPLLGRDEAERLALAVAALYEVGYGLKDAGDGLEVVIAAWVDDPARNPRRLARGLVEMLDGARDMPSLRDQSSAS